MKKSIVLSLLSLLFFVKINAQTTENLVGKMLSLPENKAYLSFDKPYYTAGETMYFKAFLTDATSHVPDSTTTVLYVNSVENVTNRVILQQKIKIEDGHASGSFNTEGVKGSVFVHAFTRWMGNLSPDFHFNKSIEIFELNSPKLEENNAEINTKNKTEINAENTNKNTNKNELINSKNNNFNLIKNVQFFPESGNLLINFPNRMAFKATDFEGKGVAIKGIIKNEKGEKITEFEDSFLGMGRFNLIVKKDEKYTAFIQYSDGTNSTFPLPDAQTKSAAIGIDRKNDTSDVRVTLLFGFDSLTMPNSFFLMVHQRGKVCFNRTILVNKKEKVRVVKLNIPQNVFDEEGIATATLFDDKGNPIAERLFFIKNEKCRIVINITTEKEIFEKRERVTATIDTKTPDGTPVAADLSFSVVNNEKITPPQYGEDLRSYLLLRSDLRGHIEQPNYYFENSEAARLALDNLLMTQGWRRFNWREKTDTAAFKHEHGLSVSGRIQSGRKPMDNASLLLILSQNDKENQSFFTKTDKNGHFHAENLDFIDTARLSVKPANSSKTYKIEEAVEKIPPSVSDPKIFFSEQPSSNFEDYLAGSQAVLLGQKMRLEREIALQELVVKAKKKDPLDKDPRLSVVKADLTFTITENNIGPISSYLQTHFIKVVNQNDGSITLFHGRKGDISENKVYAVVVDGVPDYEGRILIFLNTDEVERIDIINIGNGGFSTPLGTEGVVHILTKRGDRNYWKTHKGDVPTLFLKGYTQQRQFYTPDYDVKKPEYALPDHRTTLYWSPIIHTDATGKATVTFFTTDDAQTARILVEGVDGMGKIGIGRANFKVN